jgi:hypothetical protein
VKQAILQANPPQDICAAIVWIRMLALDNAITARAVALTMRDPRVQHFYDPHGRAGASIAASLGAPGKKAWDMYLFYPAGPGWPDGPPPPSSWAHQLKDSTWADPSHYHRGADLIRQLQSALAFLRAAPGDRS